MFVTPGSRAVFRTEGGDGKPHRAFTSSRPSTECRMMGANWSGYTCPGARFPARSLRPAKIWRIASWFVVTLYRLHTERSFSNDRSRLPLSLSLGQLNESVPFRRGQCRRDERIQHAVPVSMMHVLDRQLLPPMRKLSQSSWRAWEAKLLDVLRRAEASWLLLVVIGSLA